ncbi:MAG: kinase [Bryobacteraceae bacterium]
MIISRTPYRISFLGGGTDYPAWYRTHGGAVLAATINKYCYITCRYLPPFLEHRIRIVYSKMENCDRIDEIAHPAVREALRYLAIQRGVEIHHDGDLPARSGMGSSSAFTVGLLNALYALKGVMKSKLELAKDSIHLEQEVLQEVVGSQDQVLAAHGGLLHVSFHPGEEFTVRPVTLTKERMTELNAHLMLFYTGIKRTASDVASTYARQMDGRKRQLRLLQDLVDEGVAALSGGQDIRAFGELLHEAWQAKRELSSMVSNRDVDAIYEAAMSAGAIGGKLTGAGGGGFMLLFVPPPNQKAVTESLKKLVRVPFKFESSGSQVIFYDPEEDYSNEEEELRAQQTLLVARDLECTA